MLFMNVLLFSFLPGVVTNWLSCDFSLNPFSRLWLHFKILLFSNVIYMIYECTIRNISTAFAMPKLEKFDLIVNTQILHCIEITTNSVYTYVYLESLAIEFSRSFAAKCECRPLWFFLAVLPQISIVRLFQKML